MAQKEKILDKAQKFLQKGQLDKAIAEYRAAVDVDPRDISIRLKIGDLYVKAGKNQDAIKEYIEVAKANAQRGFYLKAIAVYKQVLKLDETNLDIHSRLADLYVKQRLIADAISEFSYIVSVLEKKGRASDVLDLLRRMVETDPENVGVRMKLADLLLKLNFEKDAIAEYSGICERLAAQGKQDKAEKIYLSLYNSGRKDIRVLKGLADIYKARAEQAQFLKYARLVFDMHVSRSETESAKEMAYAILEAYPEDDKSIKYLEQFAPKISEPQWQKESPAAPPAKEPSAAKPPAPPKKAEPAIEPPKTGHAAEEKRKARESAGEKPQWEEEIEITLEGFDVGAEGAAKAEAPPIEEKGFGAEAASGGQTAEAPSKEAEPEIEIPAEEPVSSAEAFVEAPAEAGSKEASPGEDDAAIEVTIPVEEAAPAMEEPAEALKDEEPIVSLPQELEALPEEKAGPGAQEPVIDIPAEIESLKGPEPEAGTREESLEDALKEAVEAIEELEERSRKEPEATVREEALIEEPVFAEEAPATGLAEAPEEKAVEEPVSESSAEAAPIEESFKEESPAVEETALEATAAPAEEILNEGLPPAPSEEPEEAAKAEEEISEAITELLEKMEPREQLIEAEKAGGEGAAQGEEYVDLTAELGMEEAAHDKAESWGEQESKETFDEFRSGIGKQLSKEDTETHYNLGIAYMEMELHSEAAKEFKIALKDPRLEFDCYTRLGLCAMAENNPQEAVVYYIKGLKLENKSDEERKGMMYELALAYEASGNFDEASHIFSFIHNMDPKFRDISKKVREHGERRPLIPLDDGLVEVEIL